ncbi:MFS transporter [Emcibacter nanhaiensis]|uniref:MFS transporter n=2 Tax=Emcibacter nanhaiensis TaxID=1505037 RepID=A0A501PIA2_9PROT|nr:MFS transporter [Emcibacter nanhaiensis]
MLIDGYDLAALPLALPYILPSWEGDAAGFGPALAAVLLGLGAGALLLAPLGDRFGRRKLIIPSLLAVALFTIGTGFSSSIGGFTFWRLLTGTALGACLPNVTALVAELAPKRRRAGIIVFVSCGVSLGAAGAGLVVPWLVSLGGWQMIFYMSGFVTLLIALLLYLILPDSPGYLLRAGRHESLDRLLTRLRAPARAEQLRQLFPDREKSTLSAWRALFEKSYLRATLVYAGLFTINSLTMYSLVSWLPTLLPSAGFSADQAARFASVMQIGGLLGGFLLSWLLDREQTVRAFLSAYGVVILVIVGFSLIPAQPLSWGILILLTGGGVAGAHLSLMALGPKFYPPHILSTAIGITIALGRIGAILGPLLGGWYVGMGLGFASFMQTLLVPVILCMLLVGLIPGVLRSLNS